MGKLRIVVLGAGFAGLEVTSILSERIGEHIELILIDKNDDFFFGYSKLDVMFGLERAEAVKYSYKKINKPGVQFKKEVIVEIDPTRKIVKTENNKYQADILVIALGADYNVNMTPGLKEGGNEFYSFQGAVEISKILPEFKKGNIIVGVTGFPFKCPQAPSEAALLLDSYLKKRGIRENCDITLILPFELPIPPSFGMSRALLKEFNERNITYVPEIMVGEIEPGKKLAILDDGTEIPFDLFLGIPEHCVPDILQNSGLLFDEWIPVNRDNLKTKYSNVYALGDVTSVGTPKAGVFAEGTARVAAECIITEFYGNEYKGAYNGRGSCYLAFGEGKIGKIDVDFFSHSNPNGNHVAASEVLSEEKLMCEQERKARWFNL